jgi:hypothetical protein
LNRFNAYGKKINTPIQFNGTLSLDKFSSEYLDAKKSGKNM